MELIDFQYKEDIHVLDDILEKIFSLKLTETSEELRQLFDIQEKFIYGYYFSIFGPFINNNTSEQSEIVKRYIRYFFKNYNNCVDYYIKLIRCEYGPGCISETLITRNSFIKNYVRDYVNKKFNIDIY